MRDEQGVRDLCSLELRQEMYYIVIVGSDVIAISSTHLSHFFTKRDKAFFEANLNNADFDYFIFYGVF